RLYFFFSSRRRHTRWPRDWSSDVCSSDLGPGRSCPWVAETSRISPTRCRRPRTPRPRCPEARAIGMGRRERDVRRAGNGTRRSRSEEHTSELQSRGHLVCRLLLEKKKKTL